MNKANSESIREILLKLIDLERDDPEGYDLAYAYISGVHDIVMTNKTETQKTCKVYPFQPIVQKK